MRSSLAKAKPKPPSRFCKPKVAWFAAKSEKTKLKTLTKKVGRATCGSLQALSFQAVGGNFKEISTEEFVEPLGGAKKASIPVCT